MSNSAHVSAGTYGAALWTSGDAASRQQDLMKTLVNYVDQDDAAEIKSLFTNDQNLALIVAGLKDSPYSCLHHAAAQGKDRALMAMLESLPLGVWNIRTQSLGRTPLMLVAENGNEAFALQLFLKLHTEVSACERLSTSMRDSALDALKAEFGCEFEDGEVDRNVWRTIVNAQDDEGNTPLLLAIRNRHVACSNMLLELEADREIKNNRGESPRSLVLDSPVGSEMRLLLEPSPASERDHAAAISSAVEPHQPGGLSPIRFPRPGRFDLV